MRSRILILAVFLTFCCPFFVDAAMKGTKHDMTVPGQEKKICIFCHVPHDTKKQMPQKWWKEASAELSFDIFGWKDESKKIKPPSPGSMTCLSCHDGVIARNINYTDPRYRKVFFYHDHPLIEPYTTGRAGLVEINTIREALKLYGKNRDIVECGSCHNPHSFVNPFALHRPINSLCTLCHGRISPERHILRACDPPSRHPVGEVKDPSRPSREFACSSCHRPHSSVTGYFKEKNLCYNCHERIKILPEP